MLYVADVMVASRSELVIEIAIAKRLPMMVNERGSVLRGALAAYGESFYTIGRLTAKPVQRVLLGVHPGDLPVEQVDLVRELSARYPHAHGAPIHVGDPKAIGISDLSRPDYGEPVPIYAKEIPVFWGCGVTPQAVVERACVELMITHEPAQMFLTDLPREGGKMIEVGEPRRGRAGVERPLRHPPGRG